MTRLASLIPKSVPGESPLKKDSDSFLVSVSGTGGTIGGNSAYLKEKIPSIKVILADPPGSGLCSYIHTGEFKTEGKSLTEGIGIMRLVANFAKAQVDDAFTLPDQDVVTISQFVRNQDGILLGSSTALNLAGCFKVALQHGPDNRIVSFNCDLGERSFSKLYNPDYLKSHDLDPLQDRIEPLIEKYRSETSKTR